MFQKFRLLVFPIQLSGNQEVIEPLSLHMRHLGSHYLHPSMFGGVSAASNTRIHLDKNSCGSEIALGDFFRNSGRLPGICGLANMVPEFETPEFAKGDEADGFESSSSVSLYDSSIDVTVRNR